MNINQIKSFVKSNQILYRCVWFLTKKSLNKISPMKSISGINNQIIIPVLSNCTDTKFIIQGDDNIIVIGDCSQLNNVYVFVQGSNNTIHIGNYVTFAKGSELWIEGNNCLLQIGEHSTFENAHLAVTENNSKIIIGKDCMFAYDIDVRTGDSHSIIDEITNTRTNYAKNVIIGNHVWVASHCSILKGVIIDDNCVIATRSTVTKSFAKKGVVIGGCPAKVIKNNINWDRKKI